jgi:UDP-glucose 4-epimerase
MAATMVTGGLGYTGRHIVRALTERGDQVVSYNRDFAEGDQDGATLVQGELFDIPRLLHTIKAHAIDRVVHTAAVSHPDFSVEFPVATFHANVEGTLHVLEAARLSGVRRLVYFSSETAYGNVEGPVREDAPLHPTTPYGVTKVTGELMGEVYNQLYGAQVISLRLGEVYGPGNKMPTALRDMLIAAVHGQPYALAKGGDHRFHFTHVADVARAALCALDAPQPKDVRPVFNINSGPQVSLKEAAELVRKAVPGADINIGDGFWYLDRQGEWDTSAAKCALGYEPSISLEQGIADYAAWLREHPY